MTFTRLKSAKLDAKFIQCTVVIFMQRLSSLKCNILQNIIVGLYW